MGERMDGWMDRELSSRLHPSPRREIRGGGGVVVGDFPAVICPRDIYK